MTEQIYLTTEENNAAAEAVGYYKICLLHRLDQLIEIHKHGLKDCIKSYRRVYVGGISALENLKLEIKEGKI